MSADARIWRTSQSVQMLSVMALILFRSVGVSGVRVMRRRGWLRWRELAENDGDCMSVIDM